MSNAERIGSNAERIRSLLARRAQSLRGRVVFAFALSACLVALVLSLSVYSIGRGYMEDQRMRSAERLARAHAELLWPRLDRVADPAILGSIEPPDETVLVLRAGIDWYDTDPDRTVEELLPAELIRGPEPGIERAAIGGQPYLRAGVAVGDRGDVLYEFTPISELESNLRMLRDLLTVSAAVATVIGAALGVWASRRVLKPLHQVAGTAERIASGELELRLPRTPDQDLRTTVDSFNTMVDSLQQRIERERRLVGDVSHELRTPLTTLITSVSVLNRHATELSPRAGRALDLVSAELEHLRHMLDDMLELARVEAGVHRGDTELLSVGELLEHTLVGRQYDPALLAVERDSTISGRKLELERAVGNLLDNADRHGGGVVGVDVRREGPEAVIAVDDAGPGVPPAERDRIFERFATARTTRRNASGTGTGIGLALVAETVAAHSGRVECEARPAGGARFVIRLPIVSLERK